MRAVKLLVDKCGKQGWETAMLLRGRGWYVLSSCTLLSIRVD